jgi:hypothetical protein
MTKYSIQIREKSGRPFTVTNRTAPSTRAPEKPAMPNRQATNRKPARRSSIEENQRAARVRRKARVAARREDSIEAQDAAADRRRAAASYRTINWESNLSPHVRVVDALLVSSLLQGGVTAREDILKVLAGNGPFDWPTILSDSSNPVLLSRARHAVVAVRLQRFVFCKNCEAEIGLLPCVACAARGAQPSLRLLDDPRPVQIQTPSYE